MLKMNEHWRSILFSAVAWNRESYHSIIERRNYEWSTYDAVNAHRIIYYQAISRSPQESLLAHVGICRRCISYVISFASNHDTSIDITVICTINFIIWKFYMLAASLEAAMIDWMILSSRMKAFSGLFLLVMVMLPAHLESPLQGYRWFSIDRYPSKQEAAIYR